MYCHQNSFILMAALPCQRTWMPGFVSCCVFSIIRSWKWGWKRYSDPSTATATSGRPILFNRHAIPAADKQHVCVRVTGINKRINSRLERMSGAPTNAGKHITLNIACGHSHTQKIQSSDCQNVSVRYDIVCYNFKNSSLFFFLRLNNISNDLKEGFSMFSIRPLQGSHDQLDLYTCLTQAFGHFVI